MPRFPGLRRLSSVSDYKPKQDTVKSQVIEELVNEDVQKVAKDVVNNETNQVVTIQDIQEEKEQFAVKQLREFILSHPKIINPISGKRDFFDTFDTILTITNISSFASETLFLKRFLYHRKFDQEGAEQTLINYIKARRDHPCCYQNLDIDDKAVLDLIGRGYIFPLAQKTSDGRTVIMFRNEAFSYYKYGNLGTDLFRAIVMTFEHLLCEEDNQRKGFVYIVDFAGSCLSEVMKVGVDTS